MRRVGSRRRRRNEAPRRARGDRGVGSRRRPRGRRPGPGGRRPGARARARLLEAEELGDVGVSRGGAREGGGSAREGGEGGVVRAEEVSVEAPLREELVGERAGVGAGRGGAEVFRVFSLTIAEDRVGETAEGVGRGRALVGSRARRPGAPHEVTQGRHDDDSGEPRVRTRVAGESREGRRRADGVARRARASGREEAEPRTSDPRRA